MRYWLSFAFLFILFSFDLRAQPVPDTLFLPEVKQPTYPEGNGPLVAIDGGHHNRHQLAGGFAPFAKLLRADGYRLRAITIFSAAEFAKVDVLVIVNALHESNIKNWRLPTPSAFTAEEIEAIKSWVENGGRLLVVADHMPYAGAAQVLAQTFGFRYANGFSMGKRNHWPPELYTKEEGTLLPNVFTEQVDELAGFTGSALIAPEDATIIARFPEKHRLLLPEVAWQFEENTQIEPLDRYVFGAAQIYGQGKVAFFSEAALFTAQLLRKNFKVGFNSPEASDNQRFILNVAYWLSVGL